MWCIARLMRICCKDHATLDRLIGLKVAEAEAG